MSPRALVLIAAALLCAAASPAPRKAVKPKPAPTTPTVAAKPATPKPASAGPFDPRDPASLIALLGTLDAKAQAGGRGADGVSLTVTSPAGGFQAQFAGCDAQGRACSALQFNALADQRTATLGEINAFNQSSLACRIFLDKAGKPHVLYSALLFATDTRQQMLTHIAAWRGCLGEFGDFLKDPPAYLSAAP